MHRLDDRALQEKYTTARETTQRVDALIVKTDTLFIEQISEHFNKCRDAEVKFQKHMKEFIILFQKIIREIRYRASFTKVVFQKMKFVLEYGTLYQLDNVKIYIEAFIQKYDDAVNDYVQDMIAHDGSMNKSNEHLRYVVQHLPRDADMLFDIINSTYTSAVNGDILFYLPLFQDEFLSTIKLFPIASLEKELVPRMVLKQNAETTGLLLEYVKMYFDKLLLESTFLASAFLESHTLESIPLTNLNNLRNNTRGLFTLLRHYERNLGYYQEQCMESMYKYIQDFESQLEGLELSFARINRLIEISTPVMKSSAENWDILENCIQSGSSYLNNTTETKLQLAKLANSDRFTKALQFLQQFEDNSAALTREVNDSSSILQLNFALVWKYLKQNDVTHDLSRALRDYITSNNASVYEELQKAFEFTIPSDIALEEILGLFNADLNNTEYGEMARLSELFIMLQYQLRSNDVTDGAWQKMVDLFHLWREGLKKYLIDNEIDFDFYKENFLDVEIYMKELYYEEIEQNVAYDIISLLSDIGGSLGLFVGASVITIFEVFDVIIHTMMIKYFRK